MATIIHDTFNNNRNPLHGTTPNTVDNGNTWEVMPTGENFPLWVSQSGYAGLSAFADGDTTDQQMRNPMVVDCGVADVMIEAEIYDASSSGSGAGNGVCVRCTDKDNWISAYISQQNNTLRIDKCVSGTVTNLASESVTIATRTYYKLRLTANDTAITADVRDLSTNDLLQTASATVSDHLTVTKHGLFVRRGSSFTCRCNEISISNVNTINSVVESNGFDILVSSTNDNKSNFSVFAGEGGSETERNIESALRISSTQVRLRLANGQRILVGDNVLVSSTSDEVTNEISANNSKQETNKIVDRGMEILFEDGLDEDDIGITIAGEIVWIGSAKFTGVSLSARPGEEKYRYAGAMVNPLAGVNARLPFYPDPDGPVPNTIYDGDVAVTYPIDDPSDGDVYLFAVTWALRRDHETEEEYEVGDVIYEGGDYFRCTVAGTTASSKPEYGGNLEVVDGTATFSRPHGNGSPIMRYTTLTYGGTEHRPQTVWRPCINDATKTWHDSADYDLYDALPNDAPVTGAASVSAAVESVRYPFWEIGYSYGITCLRTAASEQMGSLYGREISTRFGKAVQTAMSSATFRDELIHKLCQWGIDYIGIRESGGYWRGLEGFPHGRLTLPLFFGAATNQKQEVLDILKTPNPSGYSESDWGGEWGGYAETTEQVDYVIPDGVFDQATLGGLDYLPGYTELHDPAADPGDYGDGPANGYFPALVRGSWLFVPEWVSRMRWSFATGSSAASPLWNNTTPYRRSGVTAGHWGWLKYVIHAFGYTDLTDIFSAMDDYEDRYHLISEDTGTVYNSDLIHLRNAHFDTHRGAFAIVSAIADNTTLTIRTNRYCTGTNSGWLAALEITDGPTLSNPTQVGPRTWEFTLSAPIEGDATLTYTADNGDAVSAGNVPLGDQSVPVEESEPADTDGPVFVSATTNTVGNELTMLLDDESPPIIGTSGFSVDGFSLSDFSIDGLGITCTVTPPIPSYADGYGVPDLVYTPGNVTDSADPPNEMGAGSITITNLSEVKIDIEVTSATIEADTTDIILVLDTETSWVGDAPSGIEITVNSTPVTFSSTVSGKNTDTITITLDSPVESGDDVSISISNSSDDWYRASDGAVVVSIVDQSVTVYMGQGNTMRIAANKIFQRLSGIPQINQLPQFE